MGIVRLDAVRNNENAQFQGDFDACVFDLDGTLLNTLPDLVKLTNISLEHFGLPTHSAEAIVSFVGNGAATLISQAVPSGYPSEKTAEVLQFWKDSYPEYGHAMTTPFPGIPEVLQQMRNAGVKLAVLSNKFDKATREVIEAHFPGVFHEVHGESAEYPRKPDPTGLLKTLSNLGVRPERAVYVGDSLMDMQVAVRAGVRSVGVLWGYQSEAQLVSGGAEYLLSHSSQLLSSELKARE